MIHWVAVEPPLYNSATRLMNRLCEAWNERRHPTELMAPDFVRVDRRSMVAMPDADRDQMAEVAASMWALDARWPTDAPAIAVRGDFSALQRGTVSLRGGASVIEFLTVLHVDARGLISRLALFDPEQMDEASAELEQQPPSES